MIAEMIDFISIISLTAASIVFLFIFLKYYKGMKAPPFWIYVFGGFFLITLVNVLAAFPRLANDLILRVIRLFGHLLFLVGVLELLKTYRSRIKFDKKQT